MAKQKTPVRNKQRGKELEKEVVELAKEYGLEARRAWGSDGRSLGLDEKVDVIIEKRIRVQCKRRKKLPKYLQIEFDKFDLVATREDNKKIMMIIPLETILFFLRYIKDHDTKKVD